MAAIKKSVAELLAQASVKWVCPVTSKQFEASDADGIKAHTNELLSKEAKKAEAASLAKLIKSARVAFTAEVKVCGSFVQYIQAVNQFVKAVYPESVDVELAVERIKCVEHLPAGIISVVNAGELSAQVLALIGAVNLKTVTANNTCGYDKSKVKAVKVLKVLAKDSVLFEKINKWQGRALDAVRKMTEEDSVVLNKNPAYVQAKEQLKGISARIHELKAEHAKALAECEAIRRGVFLDDVFRD